VTGSIPPLVAAIRSGSVLITEVVAAALDAAERSQPALNAFTSIDREGALARAAALDEATAAGHASGALHGVPIALKDLIDQAGLPNTLGSGFDPLIPEQDAVVVSRLEAAGAVIIGRTGLHEFAYGFTSENEHFGPVRNPWDPALSPGGSSGGSGAAVAAGVVPMAVGTDTGGSVRVPAALCGVYGLKVTHGMIPLGGVFPLAPSLDTVGPIARSATDLAIALDVMAGVSERVVPVPVDRLRIAVVVQWLEHPMDPHIRTALDRFFAAAVAAGASVVHLDEPEFAVPPDLLAAASPEIAAVHRDRWQRAPERYGHDVAVRLEAALATPPGTAEATAVWAVGVRRRLTEILADHHVLATPTVGATRKIIGDQAVEFDGGRHHHRAVLAPWTAPVNRLGVPALALPVPGAATPPASLQLIAHDHGEATLLGVAMGLEDADLAYAPHPPIWFE